VNLPLSIEGGGLRALASILAGGTILQWLLGLGGPGLIVVGLIDNSVVPIPGGMDLCVILLTSQHREWWAYYGAFATAGAVIGGSITFRLARKGGKAEIEKKVGKKRAEKVYGKFEKGGFGTIFFGSILPPPFPMVPVLMAAGIMQYPRKRFLAALSMGRAIRFFVIAYLGRLYGTAIVGWLGRYYKPFLYILIGVGVLGGIGALVYLKWYRPRHRPADNQSKGRAAKKAA
jgi:membrane protein DedA with SNARE-associated domain